MELPATAAAAETALAHLGDRAGVVPGSFFDPLPPGGGAYVLAQIPHDWPDDGALAILRRCAETGGRVVVVERPLDGDPVEMTGMDLRMLVVFGGRERTVRELGALAATAGLRVAAVTPAGGGFAVLDCAP